MERREIQRKILFYLNMYEGAVYDIECIVAHLNTGENQFSVAILNSPLEELIEKGKITKQFLLVRDGERDVYKAGYASATKDIDPEALHT